VNWPSAIEREQIERALLGFEVEKLTIVVAKGSPWLSVDAWIHLEGEHKLALWRATGAVHELDEHGAVRDDPLLPGRWHLETL
jgi:hypothetical protein